MKTAFSSEILSDLLKLKTDGCLFHRESKDLEFKEQFSFAELAEYYRDFASFANNSGGHIIFGVSNSPRKLIGLKDSSLDQFEKIDSAKITEALLDCFSPDLQWEQRVFEFMNKKFGIFYVYESSHKPVIAKKNLGRNQEIKDGEIYYRYAGRTQKIQFSELNYIIESRIRTNTSQFLSLVQKIEKIGPSNAAILDTEKGIIQKNSKQVLVIDDKLISKIKFIREGSFVEKEGATALKLMGEVKPINSVEVTKTIQKRLIDQYPLSTLKLIELVKGRVPKIKQGEIYRIIKENGLKNNLQYSAYNFRTKQHEDTYILDKKIPTGTPSIYNNEAVNYIVNVLKNG